MIEFVATGAEISDSDPRTVELPTKATSKVFTKGGIQYAKELIDHQHLVGICTAISLTQMREKQTGKKYSPEFQYLLQKYYYDSGWFEGSSILHALKTAKRFGFLPAELWTHTTEEDRYLSYAKYAAKLQAIPRTEIERLIKLCVDPIGGFASVNVSDPQAIAEAIENSINQSGIMCRYDCGNTWWTDKKGRSSWKTKDISPLRQPNPATSGHAIIMSSYDYTSTSMQKLANTWGITWCDNGSCDVDWSNYKMTEAWSILPTAPVISYYPVTRKGHKGAVVKDLQKLLNKKGATLIVDGSFGNKTLQAVIAFQKANNLVADGIVGNKTWNALK